MAKKSKKAERRNYDRFRDRILSDSYLGDEDDHELELLAASSAYDDDYEEFDVMANEYDSRRESFRNQRRRRRFDENSWRLDLAERSERRRRIRARDERSGIFRAIG